MKKPIFGHLMTIVFCGVLLIVAGGFAPNAWADFSVFSGPQSIGVPVNSSDNESAAFLAPNGLSLYFSSNRAGGMGSVDIWVSQRATRSSAWGTPQNVAGVNSGSNENLPVLSPDGRAMFFNCSCPDATGGADIYMATRADPNNDFGWTAPVNLGAVINTANNELGPAYFEDPATGIGILYFASDRAGGLGGEDIYQSTRNANGTFSAPTNVAALNSPWLERGLNVRRDGLEIFFASERIGGSGDRDIWVSTRASISAQWNPPVNLAAINSSGSDQSPSLSPDGSILYFASPRDGSLDIYTATRLSVNRSPAGDFDGDGRTDFSVFRPSESTWYVLESGSGTFRTRQFGAVGDKIVPGDYDGDGRTDMAVYRPNPAQPGNLWYILRSSDDSFFVTVAWGISTDTPVPGDYDGDGRTDVAVYRAGVWHIVQSSNGFLTSRTYGVAGDIPIAGANPQ